MKIKNPEELTDTLHRYIEDSKYRDLAIDLVSTLLTIQGPVVQN